MSKHVNILIDAHNGDAPVTPGHADYRHDMAFIANLNRYRACNGSPVRYSACRDCGRLIQSATPALCDDCLSARLTVRLTGDAFSVAPSALMGATGAAITATRGDWRNVAYYLISELGLWSELYEQERAR